MVRIWLLLIGSMLLCGLAEPALADMYKYVDDSGAVCITNSLASVPKKFRSSMTVVKEESAAPKKLLPEVEKRTSDPLPQARIESRPAEAERVVPPVDNRPKYLRTALIIGGIIAAYFLLGRLCGSLGAPRVGTLLFVLLMLVGGVYLYGLYVKELRAVFASLRKDATNIKANVETREKKTDQMMKQLQEKE